MDKIDTKFVLIVILLALNIYQIAVNRFQAKPADVTNVFLKDKIESLDRDVNTVYLRLKFLDSIIVKIDNLEKDIEGLDAKIEEMLSITDRPVIFDRCVDDKENCYPMIPSGKAHNEMILSAGEEDGAIDDEGKILV